LRGNHVEKGGYSVAVNISGKYIGDLKVELTHGPSGAQIKTVAPVDNQGDGSTFSPTDLVASAFGACMMTLMGIAAKKRNINLDGLCFSLEKHMASDPRRIESIPIQIHMPAGLSPEDRKKLERAALTCPVHNSLPDELERKIEFIYPD
jgi:putative redox protein